MTKLAKEWLRFNLVPQIAELRKREALCRQAYTKDSALHQATQALADCHAAAALIYETELSKLGPEDG